MMANGEASEPSEDIIKRFKADGAVDPDAIAHRSLSILWYMDSDGHEHVSWKFDGFMQHSSIIGDLHMIAHDLLCHHDHD